MEYNTTKSKLINGEYGRHIQKMVEYAVDIKDRHLRTQQANAIVRTMSFFNTGTKDTDDYWHKLWDHLFILSDYKLDIDAPFPMPERESIERKVRPLPYPKHAIRFRPYGYLIENIIKKMVTEEDCPDKEEALVNVANHLKKQYLNWNRDSVNDELIEEHLKELSHGKLALKENFRFSSTQAILDDIESTASISGKNSGKNNGKNNGRNNMKGIANKNRNANMNMNVNANTNPNANPNMNANPNANPNMNANPNGNGKNKKRKKKKNNANGGYVHASVHKNQAPISQAPINN